MTTATEKPVLLDCYLCGCNLYAISDHSTYMFIYTQHLSFFTIYILFEDIVFTRYVGMYCSRYVGMYCSNNNPELTLTFFTLRSNFAT